jgi:hypothetical protein
MPAAGRCPQGFANSVTVLMERSGILGGGGDGRRRANQDEEQKDTGSGMGTLKAAIGNCTPARHSLFVSDIPRR